MSSFGTNTVMDTNLHNPLRYSVGDNNNNNNEVRLIFRNIFMNKLIHLGRE
jgi:hypothetical protein